MKAINNHIKNYILLILIVLLSLLAIVNSFINLDHNYLITGFVVAIIGLVITLFYNSKRLFALQEDILSHHYQRTLLLENSLDCVIICDKEGKIQEVNSIAEYLFGYSKDEFIGKGLKALYCDTNDLDIILKQLIEKGEYSGEVENLKKDGTNFMSFLSATIVKDNSGKIIGSLVVTRDVTKQKKLELNNEFLLNNLNEIVYTVDHLGEITYLNQATLDILGYKPDELIGKSYKILLYEKDETEVAAFYEKQFNESIKNTNFEFRLKTKDGTIIWVNQILKTLYLADQKTIIGFQGIIKNISAEKEVAEKLFNLEKSFNEIAETINDVFYLYNIEQEKYEYISPKCKNILGADANFFYSGKKHTSIYVHPEDQNKVNHSKIIVESGEEYEIEFRLIVDGETRWISEKSFPIFDSNNKVIRNSGICREITQIKNSMHTIENQNQEIIQSIDYAKNIQQATLPVKIEFDKIFPNSFVFFKPKSQISGDFYLINTIQSNEHNKMKALVVADCTGHGIPGGILSLLCNALLQETFSNSLINSPAAALDYVREKILKIFISNENRNQINDGMDVGFCVLNEETNSLYFAGAMISCFILRKDEMIEIKGDRQHIGYTINPSPFTHHEFSVYKGDQIYLFTDGFIDQFGGPNFKKYMKKQLLNIILENKDKSMDFQLEVLKKEFFSWKGTHEQTDDVTVLGVKI